VESVAFSLWGVFLESLWSVIIILLLEGFLGTVAVSSAGLTALEACELLSRHMVVCSRAMAVDCFWEISFDELFLYLGFGTRWRDKFSDLRIFPQKCKYKDVNEFHVFHLSDVTT